VSIFRGFFSDFFLPEQRSSVFVQRKNADAAASVSACVVVRASVASQGPALRSMQTSLTRGIAKYGDGEMLLVRAYMIDKSSAGIDRGTGLSSYLKR